MNVSQQELNNYITGYGRIFIGKFNKNNPDTDIHDLVDVLSVSEKWIYPCNVLCQEYDENVMLDHVLNSEYFSCKESDFKNTFKEKVLYIFSLLGDSVKCYSMESTPDDDDPREDDPDYIDDGKRLKHIMMFRNDSVLVMWIFMNMT